MLFKKHVRIEKDFLCTAKKFNVLDAVFNEDEHERIIFHELPVRGHSILTLDFVDEDGHPTKKVLNEVIAYFDEQLRQKER